MAFAASLLRSEMRRHLLMNFGLVATCVTAGTVVTNERGLFVPIEYRMSDTARAFAAMFTQSHLLPEQTRLSDVKMVSPLDAFEVTADSRDLRRRLMEAANGLGDNSFGQDAETNNPASPFNQAMNQTTKFEQQALTTTPGGTGSTVATNAVNSGSGGGTSGGGTGTGTGTTIASNNTPTTSTPDTSTSPTTVGKATTPTQSTQTVTQTPVDNTSSVITPPSGGDTVGAVPEPSTWAMLITGFGFIGYFLRTARRRKLVAETAEG